MSGLDIVYAIGDIDDRLVERSEERISRTCTNNRKKYMLIGAIAACLAFITVIGIISFSRSNELSEPKSGELPTLVYVNSQVYVSAGYCVKKATGIQLLGKIKSSVDHEPNEEFQTNDADLVGDEVYQYGEYLAIWVGDKYWVFRPISKQWQWY